ncbi:unnamed protein product [Closterium sp. NIES-65]|nr:unnamed protein product [Closterium sp. NIES-65]
MPRAPHSRRHRAGSRCISRELFDLQGFYENFRKHCLLDTIKHPSQVSLVTLSFLSQAPPSTRVTPVSFSLQPSCALVSRYNHLVPSFLVTIISSAHLFLISLQVPRWIASHSTAPATVPVIHAAIAAATPFPCLPAALKPLPFSALPTAATAATTATTLAPLTTSLPLSPPSSAHLPPPPFSNLLSSGSAHTFLRPRASYAVERAVPDADNPISTFPFSTQQPGSFICHPSPFFPGYPPPLPPTLLAAASADSASTAAAAAALPSFPDASPMLVRPRPRNATVALPLVIPGQSDARRMFDESDVDAAAHGANPAAFDGADPAEVAAAAAGAELGARELAAIRAVILRHEAAFREQVAELHAICGVQRGLMAATVSHPSDDAPRTAATNAAGQEAARGEKEAGNDDMGVGSRGADVGGDGGVRANMAEQDNQRQGMANRAGMLLFDLEQLPGNDEGEAAAEEENVNLCVRDARASSIASPAPFLAVAPARTPSSSAVLTTPLAHSAIGVPPPPVLAPAAATCSADSSAGSHAGRCRGGSRKRQTPCDNNAANGRKEESSGAHGAPAESDATSASGALDTHGAPGTGYLHPSMLPSFPPPQPAPYCLPLPGTTLNPTAMMLQPAGAAGGGAGGRRAGGSAGAHGDVHAGFKKPPPLVLVRDGSSKQQRLLPPDQAAKAFPGYSHEPTPGRRQKQQLLGQGSVASPRGGDGGAAGAAGASAAASRQKQQQQLLLQQGGVSAPLHKHTGTARDEGNGAEQLGGDGDDEMEGTSGGSASVENGESGDEGEAVVDPVGLPEAAGCLG